MKAQELIQEVEKEEQQKENNLEMFYPITHKHIQAGNNLRMCSRQLNKWRRRDDTNTRKA